MQTGYELSCEEHGGTRLELVTAPRIGRVGSMNSMRRTRRWALTLFGTSYRSWFLEVCAGSQRLTTAVKLRNLKPVMEAVDKNTGCDLLNSKHLWKLKRDIRIHRPLLTHLAPTCRIFSRAYHPQGYDEFWDDVMRLALVCGELAIFIVNEGLFMAVETPVGSWLFELGIYLRLARMPGVFRVISEMCMFGYHHPATMKLVQKGLQILTNAPWLAQTGIRCVHQPEEHTKLEGQYTGQSAAYPWKYAMSYADALSTAPKYLRLLQQGYGIRQLNPDYLQVSRLSYQGKWPNVPLTFLSTEFKEQVTRLEEARMAPGRGMNPLDQTLYDEEYQRLCNWLADAGVEAVKVTRVDLRDGTENWIVHFSRPFVDVRDGREKKTLTFSAFGVHHVLNLGTAKAAALAHTAYLHANHHADRGSYGCGIVKPNGQHGNATGEFRVFTVGHIMTKGTGWNYLEDTFVPREAFCWNSREVNRTGEYTVCKCLGHPIGLPDVMKPENITYADGSVDQVRGYRAKMLVAFKLAIEEKLKVLLAAPASSGGLDPSLLVARFGAHGCGYTGLGDQPRELLEAGIRYWGSAPRPAMSAFDVWRVESGRKLSLDNGNERNWILCWQASGGDVKLAISDREQYVDTFTEPFEVNPGVEVGLEVTGILVAFGCCDIKCKHLLDHREELEVLGMPIPSSVRHTGFGQVLTALGIERGRLLQLYKLGTDTQAATLLLLHCASLAEGLEGGGLPTWHSADDREIVTDLRTLHNQVLADSHNQHISLTEEQIVPLQPRVAFRILAVRVSRALKRYQTPDETKEGISWDTVLHRLTLAWTREDELVHERFEIAGPSMAGSHHAEVEADGISTGITLFLGAVTTELAIHDRVDSNTISIDGGDVDVTMYDIAPLVRRTGIERAKFEAALATIARFRLHGGLLQRREYLKSSGSFEWFTVVPYGGWRTVEIAGQRMQLNLRRYVVMVYHVTQFCGHRDRDSTIGALLDSGLWWSEMYMTVNTVIKHCWICIASKSRPIVTGLMRSRDYDGPFRYLIFDFVGPQRPATPRGNTEMFTCACAWSGWYWAVPTVDATSETAARCLAERVIFDIAGVSAILGSDRARAFVEATVEALSRKFGITRALGSAYHPEAQSAVERPHRVYKALCREFMQDNSDWDLMAPIFQWTVRTTTKIFNGMYTPYETLLGLKPRMPLDTILQSPIAAERQSPDKYVRDLVAYLKKVHTYVQKQHKLVRDKEQEARVKNLGIGQSLEVGDYVFLKDNRPITDGRSERFRVPWRDTIYQIHDIIQGGSREVPIRSCVLCDPATGKTDLGFSQPVSVDQLKAVEVLPLARPAAEGRTRIRISGRLGTVVNQCFDGKVFVRFDDEQIDRLYDLSKTDYEWVLATVVPGPQPG